MITNSKIAAGNQLAAQMSDVASLIYLGKKYAHQVVFYKELRHWRRGLQFFDVFDIDINCLSRCDKDIVLDYEKKTAGRRNDWQAWYKNEDGLLQCDEKYYDEVSNSYVDFTKLDKYKNGVECDKNLETDLNNTNNNFDVLSGFGLMRSWNKNDYEYVVNQFKFKTEIKNIAAQKYINIQTTNNKQQTVSVHLRRTDYIALASLNLGLKYYKEALKYFSPDKYKIVVFSDDIEFCKSCGIFSGYDCYYAEGNTAGVDLCLMSMCDNNIIANSSFSAWAARLNRNVNKKVICPYNWVGYSDSTNQFLNGNWFDSDWIALHSGQSRKNMRKKEKTATRDIIYNLFRKLWQILPVGFRRRIKNILSK